MLLPLAAIWVPTAVGLTLAAGLLGLLLLWVRADPGPDGEGDDSDSGGGWGRRRPRRPPPVGPVSWQDFERQFAAYVESRSRVPAAWDGVGDGDRAPNATAHVRHRA